MGLFGREASPVPSAPGLKGVAFDLDGTLYPNYRLYLRLLPAILRHPWFIRAFALARRRLHRDPSVYSAGFSSFYEDQAALVGRFLGSDKGVRERVERLIYRNWAAPFSRIGLFPGVGETLAAFRGGGIKLGLLSDFPPRRKLALLGLEGAFDAVLSTEETGRLKPSPHPFRELARLMALEPGEILYVGNHPRWDAEGALAAGMRAALIKRGSLSTGRHSGRGGAEFVFREYRQLREYVLGRGLGYT
ncbi:MAG: HAD family hydrolase [Treponema sp.]|jgi:putative hydrolase of the HAD superfamily|nr:HAD family hydrolase [Treponema sp.]